ncbi:SpoIVB peptidase [Virgibacillus soli]|uniref:SpoIVB peptidase n=1 Tax=Paracerasibacillus soli TaxID=480284 RepID=A0ABU5CPV1_9BACI|nr:SpoIVB peptidase [Virgibacillus soli]MDY0408393.1 SpoIVB peptidase [Virgibacillus soli]
MNYKINIRKIIGLVLLLSLLSVPFLTPVKYYLSIPNEIVTINNQSSMQLPDLGQAVEVDKKIDNATYAVDAQAFDIRDSGQSELLYNVSGMPIKKVNVSVLEDKKVIPGGQSIGVQLQTLGVLVVGHHLVNTESESVSPGEDADIKVGDMLLEINGEKINELRDVKPIVEKAGKQNMDLKVKLKRGKEEKHTTLTPAKNKKENEYQIGLYIRDSAAGIGTMTFHDPETKSYGALGHVISDLDTKKPIEINDGTIVKSSVTSIEKGNSGTPGEKQAKFSIRENRIGNITKNSPFGIFGKLDTNIKNSLYDEPMSIALSHEVKEGPAKILTVLDGEEVEEFDVKIVSSIPQKSPATKGMVIQVTDEKLLDKTGGIVQGMSGSPIIQDNKIVGAVTHVFVNDPTSGYGVHIEWMLQEAGIDLTKPKLEKKAS